jgi:dTMP kinase
MKKGKLIVIEGIDGSGKSTQLELLKVYYQENKIPFKSLKFPQYKNTFFGKTIAKFLRGEMGSLKTINPYLISLVYAMDRAEAREMLYRWMNNGKTILLDRYVSSNMAHQCGRLPKKERQKFLRWLDELEYSINHIPREDIVIYLYIPHTTAQILLLGSDRAKRSYAKGKQKDIVEDNTDYLKRAEETYVWLAEHNAHWVTVDCVDKKGNLKSREEIHENIKQVLEKKGII